MHKGIVGIVSVVLIVFLMGSVGPEFVTYIVDDMEDKFQNITYHVIGSGLLK